MNEAIEEIMQELESRVQHFKSEQKFLEANRLEQRTLHDVEMLKETGFCKGIENYSRIFARQKPGAQPYTLLDYFPKNFLIISPPMI